MAKLSLFVISALSFFLTITKSFPSEFPVKEEKLLRGTNTSDTVYGSHVYSLTNTKASGLFVSGHQQMNATAQSPRPPLEELLPGRYVSLAHISTPFPTSSGLVMEGCPDSVEILNVTLFSGEGPNVYEMDYNSGLRVDNHTCFSLPGAAATLKLYPANIPDEDSGTSFPIWLGLIPENTLQCGEDPAPQVTLSVIQSQSLLNNLSPSKGAPGMENTMHMHPNFSLVVSFDDNICPYLLESDVAFVEALIQAEALIHETMEGINTVSPNQHGDEPGPPAMDPEKILNSHFELKQLCPCHSLFPKVVSILPASTDEYGSEVKLNSGQSMERAIKPQDPVEEYDDADDGADNDGAEDMPMPIKWNGNLCPSKSIYPIGEVVSYRDDMLNNNTIKRLMLHGVVEKLFDEIRDEISETSSRKFSFKEKRTFLMKFGVGLEGMRGVIPFRRGSKCGIQNITEDFVLLVEVYHILHQLSNKHIRKLINKAKWDEVLSVETLSAESATLHVFAVNKSNDLDVCSYTASLHTRNLFAGKCDSFVPLGKREPEKIPNDTKETIPSPEPTLTNGNDTSQENENQSDGSSESDKNKKPMISPGAFPSSGIEDPNREHEQSGGEDPVQTVSPSATPSPIYPTVTPSSSLVASPTASSSLTPSVEPSPSSSPSASSIQMNSSISITPSPSSSTTSPSQNSSDADDSESACFPGDAKVLLEDGSFISMAELRIGDYIIDGSGEISRVLAFGHANPDVESSFVLINFENGALPISAQHYLPINGVLATAESAKVGDFIKVLRGYQSRNQFSPSAIVTGVERVSLTGLYNPQTTSGSIAVFWKGSAVVTSTYTRAVHPAVAHLMMWPLRWLDRVTGIVIPLLAHVLRDGSIFWGRWLPKGYAKLAF